jgi:hypothetical protein
MKQNIKLMKYLKYFWLLLKAIILRKSQLEVSFTKESNERWYVDFPNWPLYHSMLEMVAGADDLLNLLNSGSNHISLTVHTTKPRKYDIELKKVKSSLTKGAFYIVETPFKGWERPNSIRRKQLWLCPVTLTVLGQYPKQIWLEIKKRVA